ncbi:MAG: hypothetical protein RLZZ182_1360 [Pseudomonadota bacterium]
MPHPFGLARRMVLALSVLAAIQGCERNVQPAAPAGQSAASAAAAVGSAATALPPVQVRRDDMKPVVPDTPGRPGTQVAYGGANTRESDVSVAYYPGARQDARFGMRASTPMGQLAMVKLISQDPPDRVLAFYKEQLRGLWRGERTYSEGPGEDGKGLKLQAESLGGERIVSVTLSQEGPEMHIVIQSQYFNAPPAAGIGASRP